MNQRLGESHALQHSFGIFSEAEIVGALVETHLVEQFRDALAPRGRLHAGKSAVEIEHVPTGHVGREAVVFREVADGPAGFRFAAVATENQSAPGRLVRAGEQHLDERGLAGAVRAEQSVGRANRNAQRNIVDGAKLAAGEPAAEDFGQALGFDGVFGHYMKDNGSDRVFVRPGVAVPLPLGSREGGTRRQVSCRSC